MIGDQVAGIAGLKTQLQVPGTTTTTSTADVSIGANVAAEEMDETKMGDAEVTQTSPLNGAKGGKVRRRKKADCDIPFTFAFTTVQCILEELTLVVVSKLSSFETHHKATNACVNGIWVLGFSPYFELSLKNRLISNDPWFEN